MVERDERQVGARDLACEGDAGRSGDARRGWRTPCVLCALVVLVLWAWCRPTRAGSGTTGVLGISNIQQSALGGEQPRPAGRGVALQGPTRNSP